jgi:hypothetical protein
MVGLAEACRIRTRAPAGGGIESSPPVRGALAVGSLPAFWSGRLSFLDERARRNDDVISPRLGPCRMILLNHPDLVEDVPV